MSYYIDLDQPLTSHSPIPCTFVASKTPAKTLLCRESDGASMVVEPDGSQTRWMPPTDPNFDSAWTQGEPLGGFIIFRSANETTKGVPRQYKMVA